MVIRGYVIRVVELGIILEKKSDLTMDDIKNINNKSCALNFLFFNEKKSERLG